MMKSKRSSRNSAKVGLLLSLSLLLSCAHFGCSPSTAPTYGKEDITQAIQEICKSEYKLDVVVRLIGNTLWAYLPVEDLFTKSDKPEKYIEKFAVDENKCEFKNGFFKLDYNIAQKPDEEKFQEFKYNKPALEKMNNVWKVLRRVLFSMERRKKTEPRLICLVTADTKNGYEDIEITYFPDFKKMYYNYISGTEFYHRTISNMEVAQNIIDDKTGAHVKYRDIPFEEFLADQIQQRVKAKFQKPEVERNADIDKEIEKVTISTLKIYGFKDFYGIDLFNAASKNRVILNKAAVQASPIE